jgi:hypothetical protein
MSTYAFKEHLSELTPGATRLTVEWNSNGGEPKLPPELRKSIPAYHDGSRDYRIWVTMIIPAVETNWDIPLTVRQQTIYCMTEMGSESLEGPPIYHHAWAHDRWLEYPFISPEIRTLSPDLPDVIETRREVASRLHDRFCEQVWNSVKKSKGIQ